MSAARVNYDQIAPTYHQRYALNQLEGIAATLRALAQSLRAQQILEVGCGTGRWLNELQPLVNRVYGLDLSPGMLRQTRQDNNALRLVCGNATRLPFPTAVFDLIFCVNAFHHFDQPQTFIAEARRLLRSGGALAVIGMDPNAGRDRWHLYDYFPETRDSDLRRFPASERIGEWMRTAGFANIESRVVERIVSQRAGREILSDHFLQKHGTSQLALLSDEAYTEGLKRIEAALAKAEAAGATLIFEADISLVLVAGWTTS